MRHVLTKLTQQTVKLFGRVTREDGMFVVVVDGANWTTYAAAYEEALNDIPRMVADHLDGYGKLGQLEPYLRRLGVHGELPQLLVFVISLDCRDVVASSVGMTMEQVTYPLERRESA